MSQNYKIIRYMLDNGSITTREAVHNLEVLRLGARVSEIEKMGIHLEREWKSNKDTRWMVYRIADRERAKRWLKDGCSQKR